MRYPRRAFLAKVGLVGAIIGGVAIVPGVALGARGKGISQVLPESVLTAVFRPTANDASVAATINGEPVLQRAVRQQAQLLQTQQSGLTGSAARKAAFRLVAPDAAAYAEARRRGLQVSQVDAQKFTDFQRNLYQQENPQEKLPTTVAIASSGLAENIYWQQQVSVYARGMLIGKLRQQVLALNPLASPTQQAQHWQDFLNSLVNSAHIVYIDKSLQ